ncbi:4'-phosphopantetheinyl transferase superfamily protein [Caldilinea sp.]|uniref:4'-phosphopantetheinyl transferase family protein n=1 Tax=Caldilinea sp. TaxID=2293560 RepID=UPI0021DE8686|nr:4'-phosphopantetheinyl transferase superfamily protein [Caldilinea sp.]GIV67522.1 MAG: hypothetical protein KatS3mg048_0384 [Caldilinea sp.]
MIHWLIQSFDDCPEILRSNVPPAWLGPAERRCLAGFRVDKRRRDWLLGRWTAKNLVQRYLAETRDERPALNEIYIGADPDGAPYAARCEGEGGWGDLFERLPVSLSISHSHGVAFCGLIESFRPRDGCLSLFSRSSASRAPRLPSLGCDIEFIEPREPSFVRSFFTEVEMRAVEQVRHVLPHLDAAPVMKSALKCIPADAPASFSRFLQPDVNFNRRGEANAAYGAAAIAADDLLATVIWSGKEAALKAMREGLRLDTQRIACLFGALAVEPMQEWKPFRIDLDKQLTARFPGVWSGWWRLHGNHVLTVAVLA